MKLIHLVLAICFSLVVGTIGTIYAQQPVNLSKAIEDNVAKDFALLHPSYGKPTAPIVSIVYQSPTTVMLQGDLIQIYGLPLSEFNSYLWSAMDLLKNQYGFKLQQVMTTGVGSVGNPTTVYILMTK